MIFWNLLDGGLSRSGPLIGHFESMRVGTLGTNPHQACLRLPIGKNKNKKQDALTAPWCDDFTPPVTTLRRRPDPHEIGPRCAFSRAYRHAISHPCTRRRMEREVTSRRQPPPRIWAEEGDKVRAQLMCHRPCSSLPQWPLHKKKDEGWGGRLPHATSHHIVSGWRMGREVTSRRQPPHRVGAEGDEG
jgi:hypothetical protein